MEASLSTPHGVDATRTQCRPLSVDTCRQTSESLAHSTEWLSKSPCLLWQQGLVVMITRTYPSLDRCSKLWGFCFLKRLDNFTCISVMNARNTELPVLPCHAVSAQRSQLANLYRCNFCTRIRNCYFYLHTRSWLICFILGWAFTSRDTRLCKQ